VARQIHELSRRRRGPFVAVNCAAIVETLLEAELFGIEDRTATGVRGRRGKFEHAHEGTLFLDEVSDLSSAAQAKLLRAIQDLAIERVGGYGTRRVDTRIVVATNKPLGGLVADGRFRMDLYYRLHGVEVQVPPLRDRREDILELAQYFLDTHRGLRMLRLSEGAIDALRAYNWPGNVRELERVMERAVALAGSDRNRRPAAGAPGWLRRRDPAVARGARLDARVGEPLRPAGPGAVPQQQAACVPGARHLLPHPAGTPPVPCAAAERRGRIALSEKGRRRFPVASQRHGTAESSMGCAAAGARAIGDVRVSTESGLGLEEQRTSIEQAVERLGVPLFSVHVDAGFSGSLSLDQRPGLAGPQRSPPR